MQVESSSSLLESSDEIQMGFSSVVIFQDSFLQIASIYASIFACEVEPISDFYILLLHLSFFSSRGSGCSLV